MTKTQIRKWKENQPTGTQLILIKLDSFKYRSDFVIQHWNKEQITLQVSQYK